MSVLLPVLSAVRSSLYSRTMADIDVDFVLEKLDLEQKISLLSGIDFWYVVYANIQTCTLADLLQAHEGDSRTR